jgi:hypothetical protein
MCVSVQNVRLPDEQYLAPIISETHMVRLYVYINTDSLGEK